MMRKNSPLEYITATVFLIFVGVILFYSLYPFKVTTLYSIGIDKSEYCRGEFVRVDMHFDKHINTTAKIDWYIVDGIAYKLDVAGLSRQVGENRVTSLRQVPESILPGKYNLRVVSTYNVHPLHPEIVSTWNTPVFTVLSDQECLDQPEPLAPTEQQTTIIQTDRSEPKLVPTPAPSDTTGAPTEQNTVIQNDIDTSHDDQPQVIENETKTPIKDFVDGLVQPLLDLI